MNLGGWPFARRANPYLFGLVFVFLLRRNSDVAAIVWARPFFSQASTVDTRQPRRRGPICSPGGNPHCCHRQNVDCEILPSASLVCALERIASTLTGSTGACRVAIRCLVVRRRDDRRRVPDMKNAPSF